MARYTATVSSSRSPEVAFDYLAEFSSVREWDPTAVAAENLSGRVGEGAEFRVVVRFAGRENEFVYTTLEYERPRRLVLRAESPTVVSLDTITVERIRGSIGVASPAAEHGLAYHLVSTRGSEQREILRLFTRVGAPLGG